MRNVIFHRFSFANAIVFISQAQVDIHNCSIYHSAFALMSIADFSVVNITHLTVKQSNTLAAYISIQNSVILNLANSQMTSYIFLFPNGIFVFASNNCSVHISNSAFGDGNKNWTVTNVFGIFNFSSLQVKMCTFQSSHYSYSRVITVSGNTKSMFTNCSFTETSGFEVSHNSELNLTSSLITKTTNTWQTYALMEIFDNSHLYISNSSFINNVLKRNNMMLIASNSSLTMSNCVYTTNIMNYHIAISGGNATIINTRFDSNYVTRAGSGGLLVVNGTTFILYHSFFNNNIIYGDVASLITLSGWL